MSFSHRFVPQHVIDRRMQASDDRCARELRARLPRLAPEVVPYASVEIVCAWCPGTASRPGLSHGICAPCAAKVLGGGQ